MHGMAMRISTNSNNNAAPAPTLMLTLAALALVCAAGVAALWHGTMGFEVVSTEDGRRLSVARQPVPVPAVAVHAPQADTLAHLLAADGRVAIVSFIYSSCSAVCSVLGGEFQQLQDQIRRRGLEYQIRLLSISFDPRDTPAVLKSYAQRQHAAPHLWSMVAVDRDGQRQALLDTFGIVILPAPMGEFQHNAAFHLIDRHGHLVRIMDYEDPSAALDQAAALARGGAL